MAISKPGLLSKSELTKSLRDVAIIAVSGAVISAFDLFDATDFGEYSILAATLLATAKIFANRYFNIVRVK